MSDDSQVPSVCYHQQTHVNFNGEIVSDHSTPYRNTIPVYNVIKVNGTGENESLNSILHLIGYSYIQMIKLNEKGLISVNDGYTLTASDQQIPNQIRNDRPLRAHIVEYRDRLYGVTVEKSKETISGIITKVIPCTKDENDNLDLKCGAINKPINDGQRWTLCGKSEYRTNVLSGKHILQVSEKGYLFINSNCSRDHQLDNPLLLILGNGFFVIDENIIPVPTIVPPSVTWLKTKQALRRDRKDSTILCPDESLIISYAACLIQDNSFIIHGTGCVVNLKMIMQISDPLIKH